MRFVVTFTDVESGESISFPTGGSSLWLAQDYGNQLPASPSKEERANFAWGYYAAQQAGVLEQLGLRDVKRPSKSQMDDATMYLVDHYDLTIDRPSKEEEEAPLASTPDD